VFVDTSAALHSGYRLPLMICAQLQALTIYWSSYVVAELARVATRAHVRTTVTKTMTQNTAFKDVLPQIDDAMEAVRGTIDATVEQLEQLWASPSPDAMVSLSDEMLWSPSDLKDRPVFRAAIATKASYLLSTDGTAFPHGRVLEGLAFWHPDTFLTALFESEPELYRDVLLDLNDVAQAFRPHPSLLPLARHS
jgi:hypothetical protein